MNFINKIITYYKKKEEEKNIECENLIQEIDHILEELDQIFKDKQKFLEFSSVQYWKEESSELLTRVDQTNVSKLKRTNNYDCLVNKTRDFSESFYNIKDRIREHNDWAAKRKIPVAYNLIGNVEGRQLDQQQMCCIVKESHNHLVIAGAGTGKTTTVVGKVKYLLKTSKCRPQDILVLSFTNASATEMKERINRETGENITASTFHKLGLNIITAVDGVIPKITQLQMKKFINDQLILNMKSAQYLSQLNCYLLFNKVVSKSEFEFKTNEEYEEYLRLNPPTTFNNETVKSYGEVDIANFLVQHGIKYIYEGSYQEDTRTEEYGQYYPDFYLPDQEIYIEYFGIDRKGKVPSYFKDKNGINASKSYRRSMEWKRKVHKENGTILIECYAYEKFEGNLLENLEKKLIQQGINISERNAEVMWKEIKKNNRFILDGLLTLFETLINLIKSNRYTIEEIRKLIKWDSNRKVNQTLLLLLEPIYDAYCQYLKEKNEIDFNDMINHATDYVCEGKYKNPYKYIIVDEYQDISKARFSLLHALRESSDYDIFCVGDDWQSIYRFAGSDIGFILQFEKYWGDSEISKIETTYRFTQQSVELSSNFVMKNPAQIKKRIQGTKDELFFPLKEISCPTEYYIVQGIDKELKNLPDKSSILFIGRYSFDINILKSSELFSYSYNKNTGMVDIIYHNNPTLIIQFLTVHKSKGLQADYVFILNNKNSRMGFPSKIQDSSIFEVLMDHSDQYPNAEERRLFYVALTRAKKKTFLLTVKKHDSEFVMELREFYKNVKFPDYGICPECGGKLIRVRGPYGIFLGCSNYRINGCQYKKCYSVNP